jgi:hypothetical protein
VRELSCAECMELSPDVALGIAVAEDRAIVLAHIERCRPCRDELNTLGDLADALCQLAPPVEPPTGFAGRVVDAISARSSSEPAPAVATRTTRRRYLRPVSVAAAVTLAAAGGVGGWLAAGGGSGPVPAVETASFVSGHETIGQVMVVPGDAPWISVAVHVRAGTTVVRCQVKNAQGRWWTLGTFDVSGGRGYWAAQLPYGVVVRGAELLTPGGHVVATATLAPA